MDLLGWARQVGSRKVSLASLCAIFFGFAVVGGMVGVSGIAPVAASSGHFALTKWVLKFGMQRSVATHSIGVKVPPALDDERLVLLGAAHYEGSCRFCHGAPGIAPPAVGAAATPSPPLLDQMNEQYRAAELFYIVRHGIKFTGMPAWPSSTRDDEVWATVAFLRAWPRLDRTLYLGLVHGSTRAHHIEDAPLIWERCARCHGLRGEGRAQAFPVLAAQDPSYLEASLLAYAEGHRESAIMQQMSDLSATERRDIAQWLARQPVPPPRGSLTTGDALFLAGRTLVQKGVVARKVPSCEDCHGPGRPHRQGYPHLAGQPSAYLQDQLHLFAQGSRGGTRYATLMQNVRAHLLEEAEIDAVAAYYSSIHPTNDLVPSSHAR